MSKNIEKQYLKLLKDILENGVEKQDRTGTGTISVFGRQIRHDMSKGFPLLTTKKMYWKGIVTELLWFLRGDTNIKYLVDNDCHIWDGDAYKNWCKQFEVGPDFDGEELQKGHGNQVMIESLLENQITPHNIATKSYNRGRINAFLEGKAKKPDFYLIKEEFIDKIKTDDEFAEKWGELGPIYGKQWREWYTSTLIKTTLKDPLTGNDTYVQGDKWIDQIQNLINDLKTNPDSRRLMVSAWNVGELDQMTLPPCHYGFQVYTRELHIGERQLIAEQRGYRGLLRSNAKNYKSSKKIIETINKTCDSVGIPTRAISLMWNQRSVDTFLGLPFNIASYGLLLEIIAKEVNMIPDELIGNLGDVHLYKNHVDQAKEQMTREPMKLPKLIIDQFDETNHYIGDMDDISEYNIEQFKLENYQSHPTIKAPLSN